MKPLKSYREISSENYNSVRMQTERLVRTLAPEDMQPQSMPDASPVKWHLAHTTWFFETFILCRFFPQYTVFNEQFPYLFNSYYDSVGSQYSRPDRGLLTRPSVQEILDYRHFVDDKMSVLLAHHECPDVCSLVSVGLHHEMQHQELILTDLLNLFSHNPLFAAVFTKNNVRNEFTQSAKWVNVEGSMVHVGAEEDGFSYDCEKPSHLRYISPHRLCDRLVTNKEWIAFIDSGGYRNPMLWLSDGWAECQKRDWQTPLYWHKDEHEQWFQFGLTGLQAIDLNAPVCHISFYEADAFARWSGKRLPHEHELEQCAFSVPVQGNFVEAEHWCPRPYSEGSSSSPVKQLYGDVWEWTQSSYSPYPKFKAEHGALGEYNGKFMANQYVLKGGSCATPANQMRPSYRNFFHPHQRWQFTGLRLADDL